MPQIDYVDLPSLTGLYLKAALQRRPQPTSQTGLPELSARADRVVVEDLQHYRRICAIVDDGLLPPTYPQVLATPLHAALVAHPEFPLPALGMVHLENTIHQRRPINEGEKFSLHCQLGHGRWKDNLGFIFSINTTVEVDGEEVWTSHLKALSRGDVASQKKSSPQKNAEQPRNQPLLSVAVELPANLGRRYSKVCGDYNPIHLHPLTSKPFGFRRPIIHGMWTFARCWGLLRDFVDLEDLRLAVDFKKPIFLPGTAVINAHEADGSLHYRATDLAGKRLFIRGQATT